MDDDKDALDKFLNEPIDPSADNDPTRNIPRATDRNTINIEGLKAGSREIISEEPAENGDMDESSDSQEIETIDFDLTLGHAPLNPGVVAQLMAEPTYQTGFADLDEKELVLIPGSIMAAARGDAPNEIPADIAGLIEEANKIIEQEGERYSRIPELSEPERFDLMVAFGESLENDADFKAVQEVCRTDEWLPAWQELMKENDTMKKPWEAFLLQELHEEAQLWLETLGIE